MHGMNYLLAKAIQKDHLREARPNRLARLFEARRRKAVNAAQKKDKR